MKKLLIALIINFAPLAAQSETLWASKVVFASSQFGKKEYSAQQALGKPSIIAEQGPTRNAWTPYQTEKKEEMLVLDFDHAINVSQVIVNESMNPGAISRIELFDDLTNSHEVYSNPIAAPNRTKGRTFNLFIDKTLFKVNAIRITFNNGASRIDYQVDAVGISDEEEPVTAEINLPKKSTLITKLENLGRNINSEYHELSPIISSDGRTIYFTRDLHPYNIGEKKKQDVWRSQIDSTGNFGPAMNLSYPINNEYDNFAISISSDGNSMLLGNNYNKDGTMSIGVSISKYTGVRWKFPEPVLIEKFYNSNVLSSYNLSSDGKSLIMALSRKDGYGSLDLYRSNKLENGHWSEPVNLGKDLNTAEDEGSPFLAADGVTLYFSTTGRCGYGQRDLFVTRRLDTSWTNWSEPENLGPYINSKEWDAYFTIPASGKYAYMVSTLESYGEEDIYRLELPQPLRPNNVALLRGRTLHYNTKAPLDAKIVYIALSTGKEIGTASSNPETGEFSIALPGGEKYAFLAEAEGYLSVNDNLDLTNLDQYREYERDLYLAPIETGQKITLNNIFFETAKYDLLPASFYELDKLVTILNENPNINVEIDGHTDNVGGDQLNLELSQNRAKSVMIYLVNKGIDPKRITSKGFGKTKPVAPNNDESGRSLNRRVEFIIH